MSRSPGTRRGFETVRADPQELPLGAGCAAPERAICADMARRRLRRERSFSEENGAEPLLAAAIRTFADCPCSEHETQFLKTLSLYEGELAFEIVDTNLSLQGDGAPYTRHTILSGERLVLRWGILGEESFLVALPDRETASRYQPTVNAWAGMTVAEASRMVLRTDLQGLLIYAGSSDSAYAAVPRRTLVAIAESFDAGRSE